MPGPLSAAQLTSLQTFATNLTLDLTANTTRKSGSSTDGRGHQVPAWTAVLTGVACSMADPAPATMQLYPEAFIGAERKVKFSFAVGSDVKRDDRITTGGRTYRVQADIGRDSFSILAQFVAVQVNEGVD
jgi:hypothetical protein